MDYPCGLPLIVEDEFSRGLIKFKEPSMFLNGRNQKLWSALIIRIMGSSYVIRVQIFFNSIYTTNAMSSFSLVEPQPYDE